MPFLNYPAQGRYCRKPSRSRTKNHLASSCHCISPWRRARLEGSSKSRVVTHRGLWCGTTRVSDQLFDRADLFVERLPVGTFFLHETGFERFKGLDELANVLDLIDLRAAGDHFLQ